MAESAPQLYRACLSMSAAIHTLNAAQRKRMPDELVQELQDVFKNVNDMLMKTYHLDHVPGTQAPPGVSSPIGQGGGSGYSRAG